MSNCPHDRALVSRAREGDRRAFAVLVERHYPVLLSSCQRALRDAELARDAAQQAVLVAMLGLGRLREPDRFGAWLIGIGLNVCRSLIAPGRRTVASFDLMIDRSDPAAPRLQNPTHSGSSSRLRSPGGYARQSTSCRRDSAKP